MVEGWVVRVLISKDFGGLWNPVRRLVETDITFSHSYKQIQFNIIYIMRNKVLPIQSAPQTNFNWYITSPTTPFLTYT